MSTQLNVSIQQGVNTKVLSISETATVKDLSTMYKSQTELQEFYFLHRTTRLEETTVVSHVIKHPTQKLVVVGIAKGGLRASILSLI